MHIWKQKLKSQLKSTCFHDFVQLKENQRAGEGLQQGREGLDTKQSVDSSWLRLFGRKSVLQTGGMDVKDADIYQAGRGK